MIPFQPISDSLVVEVLPVEADTTGIINPYGRHAEAPSRATVLAMGPGFTGPNFVHPMPCKVGDIVWLQFNAGTEIRIAGKPYRVVPARDIFGVEG